MATEIRTAISTGALEPGARIGAERELAALHGVTRWVVRKALEELETDNLIIRTHGRSGGVFVASKKLVRDLDQLVGLPAYLRAQGLETGTTILGTGVIRPDSDVAKRLKITGDAHVYKIERARFAGGLPLSVETVYVPAELFPGLLDQSLVGSLYELLESRYAIKRGEATETITAAPADSKQAQTLQLSPGSPVLVVQRTALLESGEPFETSLEYYRFDRMAITVHTSSPAHIKRQVT
ncbi:hypothetical protein BVC93_24780 [Mycobacterium sp. MS1601]|nr:hypothetical protein BVC93_24780 [Mycobacterium sp. MS1601]